MIQRRKTRQIQVGALPIGGNAPLVVQSMCNTLTTDVAAITAQIARLEAAGCGLLDFWARKKNMNPSKYWPS